MGEYKMNVISLKGHGYEKGKELVGLYRGGTWVGKGNFCGWYATEYMEDTVLLAYFKTDSPHANRDYLRKRIISSHVIDDPKPRRLDIYSCITERTLEAENDEAAVRKFLSRDFYNPLNEEEGVSEM